MTSEPTAVDGSGFSVDHLPYGSFSEAGGPRRLGVRIGEQVLDVAALARAGIFGDELRTALDASDLGPLLAAGRSAWQATRTRLTAVLTDLTDHVITDHLVPLEQVDLHLPFPVADFVDFYSSIEHATNIGRMFRPDGEPLLPNWRHLPVGYHGRAGTVVVSGTDVVRPSGQRLLDGEVTFGPSERLDFELEVGFVLGGTSSMGTQVPASAVRDHVFGVVLVNDWSARDIQSWEYVPLGPFLGKSFATSVSAWVTPIDALEPFRRPGPAQDPPPHAYLQADEPWGLAIDLTAELVPEGGRATLLTEVSSAGLYWTVAQQLAHLTVNGASIRPGDLVASGTVSGAEPHQRGSLIERSWNGTRPVELVDGGRRRFLADGDEVVLRGSCRAPDGPTLVLGEVRGRIRARD